LEEDPTVLNTLRNRLHGEEGFTLIELLVVILIIGILAAIAIPSFLNQKGKGEDAAAKSSARSAQTALETYYTDNQTYDCTNAGATNCGATLGAIESSLPAWTVTSPPAANNYTVTNSAGIAADGAGSPTATQYRVAVASNPSGRVYWIDKTSAGITRGCKVVGAANGNNGGCKNVTGGYGTW
jgi:type IV pilus assembly protein PilA